MYFDRKEKDMDVMYFDKKQENLNVIGVYNADKARKAVENYRKEVAAKAFQHALDSELFLSVTENIKKAAHQGLSMITVYPVDTAQYDEYYDNNPSTLGTTLPTKFTQEQLNILHVFEQLDYHVVHTAHAGYKPKNMPSMNNGGWVYDVETMTISW